jgi:hypothetical protein
MLDRLGSQVVSVNFSSSEKIHPAEEIRDINTAGSENDTGRSERFEKKLRIDVKADHGFFISTSIEA